MSKTKNLFEKRIKENKEIHDKLLKKELENLNKTIQSEKYNVDTMLSKTGLTNIYHDLLDSKDKINSDYQRKYNETYHSIDVELYKLNKKLDKNTKMFDYKINNKKEQIKNQIMNNIM